MYREDAPHPQGWSAGSTGRPRFDLRHVTFPTPGAFNRPLNLAPGPVAAAAASEVAPGNLTDAGEYEPSFPEWLFRRAGLDPDCYKPDSLARRAPACLRALGVDATGRARSLLRRRPELLPTAIDAALVGVTYFFRDPDVFQALEREVVPALLTEARKRPLRVWSAGCSNGKELYSIAMMLADLGMQPGRAQLLGTDVREAAINAARAGRFAGVAVDAVPQDRRARYFTRDASGWQIADALRATLQWRRGNLLVAAEPGPWDLILCRNVAIYLRPDAAARLWQSLANALRPGGFLVLGRAERPLGTLGLQCVAPCVYRKTRDDRDDASRVKLGAPAGNLE